MVAANILLVVVPGRVDDSLSTAGGTVQEWKRAYPPGQDWRFADPSGEKSREDGGNGQEWKRAYPAGQDWRSSAEGTTKEPPS